MDCRVRFQLAEALSGLNKWYCCEAYGRAVNDNDLLLTYYIKSGGARDFAERYAQALGKDNRWFCSEFYRREIRDPEILWDYYMTQLKARTAAKSQRCESHESHQSYPERNIAC